MLLAFDMCGATDLSPFGRLSESGNGSLTSHMAQSSITRNVVPSPYPESHQSEQPTASSFFATITHETPF